MKYLKKWTNVLIGGTILVIAGLLISQERIKTRPHEGNVENDPLQFQDNDRTTDDRKRYYKTKHVNSLKEIMTAKLDNTLNSRKSMTLKRNGSSLKLARNVQVQLQKMQERMSNINEKCKNYMQMPYWQKLHLTGKVWTYEPEQIHYCVIYKIGSTFWKKILRFLSNDYHWQKDIQRPSDLDRAFVHIKKLKGIQLTYINNPNTQRRMSEGKSFMFVREPYSRLWSAYIDKIFLPDFWGGEAKKIIRTMRPNATIYEKWCANNVTFYEFLAFINLTKNRWLNGHWDMMHRMCSPCHVHYDVIGKLESFSDDVDLILTKFNLENLKENTSKLNLTKKELRSFINFNFNLEPSVRTGCFDKLDIAKRLWQVLQFNGYIDRSRNFPEAALMKSNFYKQAAKSFSEYVLSVFSYQYKRGIDLKAQKRTMMLEEYRKIPQNLLRAIATLYKFDFDLFGYNEDLFS